MVWPISEELMFDLTEESGGVSLMKEAWLSLGERARPGSFQLFSMRSSPHFSTARCPDLGGPLSSIPSNPSTYISSKRTPLPLASSVLSLQTPALLPLLYLFDWWGIWPFCPISWWVSGAVSLAFSPHPAISLGTPRVLHCTGLIEPDWAASLSLPTSVSASHSLKAFLLTWQKCWGPVGRLKIKETHMQLSPTTWVLTSVFPLIPIPVIAEPFGLTLKNL